ncbi:MAG: hypothetical protein B7Z31_00260 [Rhodobacterales bacterium 12-65-15]|nr:MAG: hypothetical protein B7Z31_00260 [Rhodobacterales bacterium 12-65-15]
MFSLVPLPYRILAAVLLGLALFGSGVGIGRHWAANAAEAERAKEAKAALAALNAQIARGNTLSARLAQAEGQVVIKTVEVIKNVPIVTTGRLCLGADAVRLLHPATDTASKPPASPPAAESPPALAASDRDVAYWVASANAQYDTCALRLNALVDYENSPE